MKKIKQLQYLLLLIGAAIWFLGLNIGPGGMQTLGWQGAVVF